MNNHHSLHPADRLEVFESIGSTHDEVLRRAREGDPGHLWVLARQQTGGRGRLGRPWISPPGNFYASYLLIDPAPLRVMAQLGFVAGVALADSVCTGCGLGTHVRIKWPNDLMYQGAKLSGLLLETVALGSGIYACALGFGVNLVSSPDGLAYPTANLVSCGGPRLVPEEFAGILSRYFAYWLDVWASGAGFSDIRQAWLERAAQLGQPLRVQRHDGPIDGLFSGIDSSGRLLLRCKDALVTIEAGDVFLA